MDKASDITTIINIGHFNVDLVTKYLENNKGKIYDFVMYAISNEKNSWRAAWALSKYAENSACEIQAYTNLIINKLPHLKKEGQIRELLKLINKTTLSEEQTCKVMDYCFECVQYNKLQSSVRSSAFYFLINTAKLYPEIKTEIEMLFENTKDYYTNGIKKSIQARLNRIISTKKI